MLVVLVVSWRWERLLKFSQGCRVGSLWKFGGCWMVVRNVSWFGAGGYVLKRITAGRWDGIGGYPGRRITHQFLTIHRKPVIISVANITKRLLVTRRATMALESVLPRRGIKSRRTDKNAVQSIYIKYGNTETA